MSSLLRGISTADLTAIIKLDCNMVASDPKKYLEANRELYRIACNTWLFMCEEVCGSAGRRVLNNSLLRQGLLATIREAERIANLAIQSDFTAVVDSPLRALFTEDPRLTLQVLRYLKRFSPFCADKVQKETMAEFLAINRSLKGVPLIISDDKRVLKRTQYYPTFLIKDVRKYCMKLLGNPIITDEKICLEGEFSNGVTADGAKVLADKTLHYRCYVPYYKHYTYPISEVIDEPLDFVKAVSVPKSYKSSRIIAEVPAYQQFHMQGIRKLALKAISKKPLGKLMVQDDQTINQEWSRLGSVYGTYATIDLSAASDSISEYLAEQVLPDQWYKAICRFNPPVIDAYGSRVPRYIFQTSGNGTTFILESVIFLAIALSATSYCRLYDSSIVDPRVFGDDIICDDKVYDTLVDFLGLLGFKVNLSKSFSGTSRYRESCGAEWYCGLDTATKYFPRKQMDVTTPEGQQSLIELQHRLYEFKMCDDWLVGYIRDLFRKNGIDMTSSYPGSECSDLWEDFPLYKVIKPPYDHSKGVEPPLSERREGHYALVPSISPVEQRKRYEDMPHKTCTDIFAYVDFLQHGPSYDEEIPVHGCAARSLDELLRVSKPRSVPSEYMMIPMRWGIVK